MIKLTALLLVLFPMFCIADSVVPIDKVENDVNIRLSPDASSEIVGKLEQGSSAEIVNSIEGWYEVRLVGGATGFISADWTRVVSEEEAASAAELPEVEPAVEMAAEEVAAPAAESAVAEVAEVAEEAVEVAAEEVVEETVEEPVDDSVEQAVEAANETAIEEVVADDVMAEETVAGNAVAEEAGAEEAVAEEAAAEEAVAEEVTAPAAVVEEVRDEVVQPNNSVRPDLKGRKDFLVRFRSETAGESSQIYDNGHQIGIGTTEPKQRLEVNGSIQIHEQNSSVAGLMITQSSGDTGYIMHNRANTLTIGAGSQDRITIDRDGNVGIAVSRPKHPLEMASGAHVTAGGVWTNSSSRDSKENIAALQLEAATNTVMALRPVVFNYKTEAGENYVGFIAEDVPELVAVGDHNGLSAMDIVAVLTRVVQEQEKKIQALEARLDAL